MSARGRSPVSPAAERPDRQRLDKWLWCARFVRQRNAAVRLIDSGHVRIAGRRAGGAGHGVKAGDVLTLALPGRTLVVRVTGLQDRRGSAADAALMYALISGPAPPRDTPDASETLAVQHRTG